MGRFHSYINTAEKILQPYNGEMPFSIFIKQFFAKEKKYGSKDRKQIAALCYSYFRVGLALNKEITTENLLAAFFIVNNEPSVLIQELKFEWHRHEAVVLEEKIKLVNSNFTLENIFPFANDLNAQTNVELCCQSILQQPNVFARIRPQYKQATIAKIKTSGVQYELLNDDNCVQFLPGTNIDTFLLTDKEVTIQDYNSQQVLNYLQQYNFTAEEKETTVWDCCAASGGKSILAYDLLNGQIKLTVSDIRQSIIVNLQQRFKNAGIKNYRSFVADISDSEMKRPAEKYDIIICDAPCTGSGTWARTPEQLYFFNPSAINEFAATQKKIATNVLQHLNKNGLFFYITCSIFTKENEAVAQHIAEQKGMELIEMKNLFGYQMKADSMFVAVFRKKI